MCLANKYFLTENTRVVITGKAADVLPALEKLSKDAKLPIFYFDKFGNPAEKPVEAFENFVSSQSPILSR